MFVFYWLILFFNKILKIIQSKSNKINIYTNMPLYYFNIGNNHNELYFKIGI